MDYFLILKQRLEQIKMGLIKMVPEMILATLSFVLILVIARMLKRYTRLYILRKSDDLLLANFLSKTLFTVIIIFGTVVSLGVMGLSGTVTKILAGAGLSGFIIGFAFKDIGENFLAGILLAFKRPFRIGDLIETNGLSGTVYDFKLRETLIKTPDGVDAFIPNSIIIKNPLKNHTVDHLFRKEFSLGIDYRDDINKAVEIIKDIVKNTPEIEKEPREALVLISEFGEKYTVIKVLFWLKTSISGGKVQSEMMRRTLDRLKAEGYNFDRK